MDLTYVLKELWRLRIWVSLAAVVAAIIGLGSAYKLSFVPPSLEQKVLDVGAAKTQILVDSPESALPNLNSSIDPLTSRAGVFAAYTLTAPAVNEITKRSGLPPGAIAFDTGSGNEASDPEASAENSESRANRLVQEGTPYLVRIGASASLPVVSIQTQAPTGREAISLANATANGLIAVIEKLEQGQSIPVQSRVKLTQLGNPIGGDVASRTNTRAAAFTAFAAFAVFLVLILIAANVYESWRRPPADQHDETLRLEDLALVPGSNNHVDDAAERDAIPGDERLVGRR